MSHWLLVRVAWSCLDQNGELWQSPNWLADKCHWGERTLRRQVLALTKLRLLRHERHPTEETGCYLLTGYLEATGQNRPLFRTLEEPLERPNLAVSTSVNELKEPIEWGTEEKPPDSAAKAVEAHASLFMQSLAHYRRWHDEFGWKYDAPELPPLAQRALEYIGGWTRIAAIRDNPRELAFARKDFLEYCRNNDPEYAKAVELRSRKTRAAAG